jgi:enoyl-CoA hydratase/carnithine racemase
VLVQPLGKGQEVILNRPKALNALNLNMVHLLRPHYTVRRGREPALATVWHLALTHAGRCVG